MEDRINRILRHYNLSSSQFADEIGVQRSSVSHVLTGRNKPGFDFIQKIIGAFPDVSAEWLITGVGSFIKDEKSGGNQLFIEQKNLQGSLTETGNDQSERDLGQEAGIDDDVDLLTTQRKRSIEKIIIIYDDKSFDEYHPQ